MLRARCDHADTSHVGRAKKWANERELPTDRDPVVLIIDDEEIIRRVAVMALEPDGYTLLVAESGEAALELSRSFPLTIDLVLTDLRMRRGMDGLELRDLLLSERPGTLFVVMSGDTFSGRIPDGVPVIQKPFTIQQLQERVRKLLYAPRVASHRVTG